MTTGSLRAFATWAKAQGMSSDAVSYYHRQKSAGRLVMVIQAGKELVDFEASLASLRATSDPDKAYMAEVNDRQREAHRGPAVAMIPGTTDDGIGDAEEPAGRARQSSTYMQAKTAREVFDAKMSQLDYERESGKLISADAMRSAWATKVANVRDALLQIPSRLAPVLAAESDLIVVTNKLETELRQALAELSTTK